MKTNTDHTEYSGNGFVDGYGVGATTSFTVNAVSSGPQAVTLRNGNGTPIKQTVSPSTVPAGTNTVALEWFVDGGDVSGIDNVKVVKN